MFNPGYRRSLAVRGLALAALALLTSCHPCNANVCQHILWVTLTEVGGGPLLEGQYVFDLTVDGVATTATCDIGPGGTTASCTALDPASGSISADVYDSPNNPHKNFNLQWQVDVPKTMKIHIEHDGVVVLDTTIEPDYEFVDEVCDGDCRHASEDLELLRS